MNDNKFKFSVIVPVYNAEKFLSESIESIINQTIGFEENIQLILINDGSKDNSESICLKYQNMYPENIIYKYKKNGGVSSARNEGRKYVKGKYLNFLDSDDKWDLHAFERAYSFFENHYDEIDVLIGRTIIFGEKEYIHPLDYKFDDGTRIIDLNDEYYNVQITNTPCFYKVNAIKDIYHNQNLKVSEDTLFLGEILLNSLKCGVIKEVIFYYRRLNDETSLSNKAIKDKTWYSDIFKYCHEQLIKESIEKYGTIKKYIQYMILYELQWRINKNIIIDSVLNEKEVKEYKKKIIALLKQMDDDVILNFKKRPFIFKLYLLKLKYNNNLDKKFEVKDDSCLYFDNIEANNLKKRNMLEISVLEISHNNLILKGKCELISELKKLGDFDLKIEDNNQYEYKVKTRVRDYYVQKSFCDDIIKDGSIFEVKIPIANVKYFKFKLECPNGIVVYLKPKFGKHSGLSNSLKNTTYRVIDKHIVKFTKNKLYIIPNKIKTHIKCELKLLLQLLKKKKYKIIFDRISVYISKPFYKKPIWLVRDKYERAGDNGESIFKYLSNWDKKKDYNIYFVLRKDSIDYANIKKYGKVVDPRKRKYRKLFLLSSKLIDSTCVFSSINPFDNDFEYYRDLYKYDYVGLFHGIGQRDMSSWTNDFNYNVKVYVSGAKREYDAMIKEDNGYDENIIKLTGLPRFDELEKNTSKTIAFMPTWRDNIANTFVPGTNIREYVTNFKNTDYFKFYNSLINNKQLIEAMKKYGYKGVFYNHPNFVKQVDDYDENEIISVSKENARANEVISNCALLVTDYSSAAFECAYLNKPVVYTQFDYDTFVENHTGTEGYFSYEKDSFGPVCHDEQTSVDAIIKYLKNNCTNDKKYESRIKEFFIYHDRNNCKRVVDEIVKFDQRKKEENN